MNYLTAFVELFRFLKRYRERKDAQRQFELEALREEREHQLKMLETIFSRMVDLSASNNAGILELAKAQQAQADVLATWLKGFHISDPTPTAPSVVRDEDEWTAEQRRKLLNGDPDAFPVDLPPEFQLAFAIDHLDKLNQDSLESEGFDREGSDLGN